MPAATAFDPIAFARSSASIAVDQEQCGKPDCSVEAYRDNVVDTCREHGVELTQAAVDAFDELVAKLRAEGVRQVTVSSVKPGEFVRRKIDAKKTFKRGAYDRATRSYELHDCDDINRSVFVKATALVFVGFTY